MVIKFVTIANIFPIFRRKTKRRRRDRREATFLDATPSTTETATNGNWSPRKSPAFRFRRIFDAFSFGRPPLKLHQPSAPENEPNEKEAKKNEEEAVVTLLLEIRLNNGENLPVKDASGSSDPYVKFRYKDSIVYKSGTIFKNLNPSWDEEFQMIVDDVNSPMRLEVFDFDRFCTDDFMGSAEIELSQIKWCTPTEVSVDLIDDVSEAAGRVTLSVTISPMTQAEAQQFAQKSTKGVVSLTERKKEKGSTQEWLKVVNVVLVEGRNIRVDERCPDAFCKFKLGMEKYKTKVCAASFEPKWIEQFDMHIFDSAEQNLQIACIDRATNAIIGRLNIDIAKLSIDDTIQNWYRLEGAAADAEILLLISVSGTTGMEAEIEADDFNYNDVRNARIAKYDIFNSFSDLSDVGVLTVKIFCAEDLQAKDFGGKSDPFAVIELVNTRAQTHTVYKTLNPNWNKIFTFAIKDIHTCVQVSIYDEDPNNRFEFLGRVAIPLLSVRNCEKRWYPLKDEKLRKRVKGDVLIELDVIWNPLRAALRTFKPKERKFVGQEQKFKASLFRSVVVELKDVAISLISFKDSISYLFSWHSKSKSSLAFLFFVVFVYFFEIYFIPLVILSIFAWNFIQKRSVVWEGCGDDASAIAAAAAGDNTAQSDVVATTTTTTTTTTTRRRATMSPKTQKSEEEDEKASSLRETLFSVQETLVVVQNSLVFVAQLIERVKNTFNFTNTWLSTLGIIVLLAAFLLLYLIPLRWIILAWGVNKFTKKLRNPNFVDNNEILDFLSRVPCRTEINEQTNQRVNRPINL